MASGGLGLSGGLDHDINQEELDFSDLFLYNPPEDFPVGPDKGELTMRPNHFFPFFGVSISLHVNKIIIQCNQYGFDFKISTIVLGSGNNKEVTNPTFYGIQ